MNPVAGSVSILAAQGAGVVGRALATNRPRRARAPGRAAIRDDIGDLLAGDHLRYVLAALGDESRAALFSTHLADTAGVALEDLGRGLREAARLAARPCGQPRVDAVLHRVDEVGAHTAFHGQRVFDGSVVLNASGLTLPLERLSTTALGLVEERRRRYCLADVATGGPIDLQHPGRLARRSILLSRRQVRRMHRRLELFQHDVLAPRLTTVSAAIDELATASVIRDPAAAADAAAFSRDRLGELDDGLGAASAGHRRDRVLPLVG